MERIVNLSTWDHFEKEEGDPK